MTTILVIEDNRVILENMFEIFELEDFDSIGVENGSDGIRLARERRPDLIICDILIPGLDGYDVLEELSKDPSTAAIPFIFLSAKADKASIQRGMERGADDYLTKPFEPADLLAMVHKWLGSRR